MYDDPYADDLTDPFQSPNNDFEEEWYPDATPAHARAGAAPKALAGVLVALLIVGVAAGGYWLVRRVVASPVDTVRAFYDSLNRRDFDAAAALIAPQAGVSAEVFANAESVAGLLMGIVGDEILAEFDIEGGDLLGDLLDALDWEFREMEYTAVEQTGDRAIVRVTGQLHVTLLGFEMPVPWDLDHTLVRRDGQWYLALDF